MMTMTMTMGQLELILASKMNFELVYHIIDLDFDLDMAIFFFFFFFFTLFYYYLFFLLIMFVVCCLFFHFPR